jgi:urease accessory protein
MTQSLLALLQMTDSALPVGGYSQSWGLETWVQAGTLKTATNVEAALLAMLDSSLAPSEGVSCALAHSYAMYDDRASFNVLNEQLTASKWCKEPLEASLRIGERMKNLAVNAGWLSDCPDGATHHSAAFGWIAARLSVDAQDAVAAYLLNTMTSLVSACVRMVPLGHTDGQRIVTRLRRQIDSLVPQCMTASLDDLGSFAPMNEWACREHESLYSRLFQS